MEETVSSIETEGGEPADNCQTGQDAPKKRGGKGSPVLRFRVAVCLVAAAVAAAVRFMSDDIYEKARELYIKYTFCSIVADGGGENESLIKAAENDFKSGKN